MDQPRTLRHPRLRLWTKLVGLTTLTVVFAIGCSGGTKTNAVKGKVTLDGQPVAGVVTFVGPSKKKSSSPIKVDDGTYQINDAELGDNQIYIEKGLGAGGPGAVFSGGGNVGMREMPKDMGKDMPKPAMGVEPPEKYTNPSTSGLHFNVTGGTQEHDITLTK